MRRKARQKFDNPDSLNRVFYKSNYQSYEGETRKVRRKVGDIYFSLPKSDFVTNGGDKIPQSDFIFGLTTLPIKMRFGNPEVENGKQKRYFDFAGEISLGISTGWRRRTDPINSFSVLTGIAITSVPIDSFTSKGLFTSPTNVSALTWHLGILYQHKVFQIGLFSGIDYLKGELGKRWVYRHQPWLGIGLGIAILNTDPAAFSAKK